MDRQNDGHWAVWLFLPDYMIMRRITDGRLRGNTYGVFLVKYLLWFLIGEVMCMVAVAMVGGFKWMYAAASLAVVILLSALFAAFSYRHLKDNKYFKEKYGKKQQEL